MLLKMGRGRVPPGGFLVVLLQTLNASCVDAPRRRWCLCCHLVSPDDYLYDMLLENPDLVKKFR